MENKYMISRARNNFHVLFAERTHLCGCSPAINTRHGKVIPNDWCNKFIARRKRTYNRTSF